MDLQSAAEAERAAKSPTPAAEQKVHVETRGVTFNRASGTALSDQPVSFTFPNGTGEAVGVQYDSEEGKVRLIRDVRMSLEPPKSGAAGRKGGKGVQWIPFM
jgi:lipopolysaccharide export system protein LptC